MQPNKDEAFSQKRATNIDGFYARPVQDRRSQPVFRSQPAFSAFPQPATGKLGDMPQRRSQQSVLASSPALPMIQSPPASSIPIGDRPRDRKRFGHKQKDVEAGQSKGQNAHPKKRILKRIGLFFGALVLVMGLLGGWYVYKNLSKLTGNKNPLSLLGAFHPVPLKNQNGRVNILVAGNSADDAGHNGGNLTDSIMVLSVDTQKNTALMLSIPRDTWVEIPGHGHSKINAAYTYGGMNKLQQVVEDNLDMTIDYQVLVNYTAFKDLVDALGGISITIKSDDPRGIYDPSLDYTSRRCCALAKYPNGTVNLNGKQALNLARARGDAYGSYGFPMADFDRTQHQRQMLMAIKTKASSTAVIANPFKVANLIDAVGSNVKTNLEVAEIQTLYTFMKKVDDSKIDSYNINTLKGKGTTMLTNYTSPDGQSALIPAAGVDDFTEIAKQIKKVLTADPVTKEGATVVVLNGTDTTGLAGKQQTKLSSKGMTVYVGDASANQPTTTIIDKSGGEMPNTLNYLKTQYKATVVVNNTLAQSYPSADFIVILGQSAVPKPATNTTPTTAQ
jgi:LCP family protein required for cell wall assembly